jgi:dTDP-4-dehydrorhamnose reductase
MDRLLITGGSGYIGGKLCEAACKRWKTYATYHASPVLQDSVIPVYLDIGNREQVQAAVHIIKPSIIIHAAAITNCRVCWEEQDEAWHVNVNGTEFLASVAEDVGARMLYLSTDLVFDGEDEYYTEENEPNPVCFYGKTKYAAEKIVSKICSNYTICRCALVYGWDWNRARPFTKTIIQKLSSGEEISLFTDEFRSLIYDYNLCEIILNIASQQSVQGIYHLGGEWKISRYDLGLKICEIFKFNKGLLIPISIDRLSTGEKRPSDCSLLVGKAKNIINNKMMSVDEGLLALKELLGPSFTASKEINREK